MLVGAKGGERRRRGGRNRSGKGKRRAEGPWKSTSLGGEGGILTDDCKNILVSLVCLVCLVSLVSLISLVSLVSLVSPVSQSV